MTGMENIARSLIPPFIKGMPATGPGFAIRITPQTLVSLVYAGAHPVEA